MKDGYAFHTWVIVYNSGMSEEKEGGLLSRLPFGLAPGGATEFQGGDHAGSMPLVAVVVHGGDLTPSALQGSPRATKVFDRKISCETRR